MEPPPAPMVWMSSWGIFSGQASIWLSCDMRGASPCTRAASVLVPPMSNVMMSSTPALAATRTAPVTPPTGPDRNVPAQRSAAAARVMAPPFEPMMLTGAVMARSCSAFCSAAR